MVTAALGTVTFTWTLVRVHQPSPSGLRLDTMRACVPLTVAILCGLAWAGKSLLVGMTGVLKRAGEPGRESVRVVR